MKAHSKEADGTAENDDDEAEGDLLPPGLTFLLVLEPAKRFEQEVGRPEGHDAGEYSPAVERDSSFGVRRMGLAR